MEEEICRFACGNKCCQILVGIKCQGIDEKCKFYKTDKQYIKDRDKAILKNRTKGNCDNCKYMNTPCQLSSKMEDKLKGEIS